MHQTSTKPQFRTGPHMGIPYEQALALGLSSALNGREAYENYQATIKTSTPSQRLLRGHSPTFAIVDDILDPGMKPFPACGYQVASAHVGREKSRVSPNVVHAADAALWNLMDAAAHMTSFGHCTVLIDNAMAAEKAHQEHRKGARRG